MKIEIVRRLRPFTHIPGRACFIPSTHWQVKCFPTRLVFSDLMREAKPIILDFDFKGPIKDFTCMQNLEKGIVEVWGITALGYFCFAIKPHSGGLDLEVRRLFSNQVAYKISCGQEIQEGTTFPKDRLTLLAKMHPLTNFSQEFEKLSLGSHKKQNWDSILIKEDMKEIFPVWLKLGQLIALQEEQLEAKGLLQECETIVQKREKNKIIPTFTNLFKVGFTGIMVPCLQDQSFSGILEKKQKITNAATPLILLKKGAALIKNLFFQCSSNKMEILPCLPHDFSCGRLTHIQEDEIGNVSIEWSKKRLRKLILKATTKQNIEMRFQKAVKKCRMRESLKDKGSVFANKQVLATKPGNTYFFDRFEK